MGMRYLSKDILIGFDKYKYNSVDTSPVSKYVTHPFWNWLVEYVPRSIAPNTLTLVGFLLLVLQFCLFTYYDHHFYASDNLHPEYLPVPRWLWLVAGLCMFWAHTLDGIDGKQARRTGTSGPLGELFDHGLDSLATLLMPVGCYSIFSRGVIGIAPDRVYIVLVGIMLTFAITHWEKYNTGVLFLPWGYDLSQIAITVLYLISFAFDYSVWIQPIPFIGLYPCDLFEAIMHASVYLFSIPISLYNVYIAYKDNTRKNRSFYEAMLPLFPLLIQFILFFVWMYCSSIDIVRKEPRLFYIASAAVFSNITCRIIVNCMSNTRCQLFNWLLIPLIAIVTGVLTLHLGVIEIYLLWAFTLFTTAAHIHYGICVVQELSQHFNIYAFSTKKKPKRN